MDLQSGQKVLLIGDSITDAGRFDDPEHLGFGYVRLFRDLLCSRYPDTNVALVNHGIGGDTIRHLHARWERDVMQVRPDVLIVSIGVNDVWRQLQDPPNPEQVLLDEFESTYAHLLTRARDLVGVRLVLCEATVIGERHTAPHNPIVNDYNESIARLARDFDATLVPMNQAFWRAIDAHPDRAWTSDGVHPLSNGHMLMAVTLLQSLGGTL